MVEGMCSSGYLLLAAVARRAACRVCVWDYGRERRERIVDLKLCMQKTQLRNLENADIRALFPKNPAWGWVWGPRKGPGTSESPAGAAPCVRRGGRERR